MPNPYLEGNFAPVGVERTDQHELPVAGVIPPDLDGRLLRNGPNPVLPPPDEQEYHWFSGDGMVHAISLSGGRATGYRNRWVRTRSLAHKVGTAAPKGPAEAVDAPANTHVIRHGGKTLALAESGFPHALSPDLERARVYDFDGTLASPMTAHPKKDPVTGELVFFGVDVFGPPFLRSHVLDASGQMTATEEIDVPRATMMRDFGMTATRVVFLDLPIVFDLSMALAGRSLPYRWMPDAGARIGIMPRTGTGDLVRWISMDPCAVFHVLNCYDEGDDVVMDVIRYDRAFDTGPGGAISSTVPALTRWTISPKANRVHEKVLDDAPVEFPRIDDSVAGSRHRYGYCARIGPDPWEPTPLGLVKHDFQRDLSVRFDPGPNRYAAEPVFVRAVDGHAEDEGWVLAVVYDATRDASDLVILDATSFNGRPVAVVELPSRIPFGFHGSWIPTTS